jgi:alanyl-tRNA synthetase
MTERLYYTDAETLEFDARVTACGDTAGRPSVVLDRTAFYPTSGGQPFDTGTLGASQVLDVIDEGEHIVHVLSRALEPGVQVHGVVDMVRRRDHMQQHTGQHVLSAAFDRLFANPTVSFHLGAETCTIDLARALTPADVERAVDEANRVVWENRPVMVRFATADEACTAGLRKQSQRQGELRLVEVADFDLSACGGTHVARTGAIGIIAATGTEKVKGGLRVSFVCGRRALDQLRLLRDAVSGSLRALSVLPAELPDAVRRLQADSKALRKRAADLQVSLSAHEADRLLAQAAQQEPAAIVAAVMDGWEATGLRAIASSLIARAPVQVALASGEQQVSVVVAQSSGGPSAADVVVGLTARFGGRGGGNAELAQAGGLSGPAAAVVQAAREAMKPEA